MSPCRKDMEASVIQWKCCLSPDIFPRLDLEESLNLSLAMIKRPIFAKAVFRRALLGFRFPTVFVLWKKAAHLLEGLVGFVLTINVRNTSTVCFVILLVLTHQACHL